MKKIISMLLAVLLLASVFPFSVFATGTAKYDIENFYALKKVINELQNGNIVHLNIKKDITITEQLTINASDVTIYFTGPATFSLSGNRAFYIDNEDVKLYFENITIDGGSLLLDDDGQAFYVNDEDCLISGAVIKNCGSYKFGYIQFYRNTYSSWCGGAIDVDGEDCTIENCRFESCMAFDDGGAIYIDDEGCKVKNCSFNDCTVKEGKGGAIYVCYEQTDAEIDNCKFSFCGGTLQKGRNVYAWNNATLENPNPKYDPDNKLYDDCTIKLTSAQNVCLPENGKYVIFCSYDPGKCFDIAGGKDAVKNGDRLQIWSAANSGAMVFNIERDGNNDYYKIIAPSGKVLEVAGGSYAAGTTIWQTEDTGNMSQRWRFYDDPGDGSVFICAVRGGYMDLSGANTANGTPIISYGYTDGENQRFRLMKVAEVPDGDYVIVPANDSGKCLAIDGGKDAKSNGGNLSIRSQTATGKVFSVKKDKNNPNCSIQPKHSGLELSIKDNVPQDGASIIQWQDYGNLGQRWMFEDAGNGYVRIRSLFGTYMDTFEGKTGDGTDVISMQSSNNISQQFKLIEPPEEPQEPQEEDPQIATYIGKDGKKVPIPSDAKTITEETSELTGGVYIATGKVALYKKLKVNAESTIILADDCELNCFSGIHVPGNMTLTICSQTLDPSNMGSLKATSTQDRQAGIGSSHKDTNSHIIICGGRIKASGGMNAAGIGTGGYGSSTVDIYNGIIEASCDYYGAGIGSGAGYSTKETSSACFVNIYNGDIKARGGEYGAGIGGGYYGSFKVNIFGGKVEAWAGDNRASGIGSGSDAKEGAVYISDSANAKGHGAPWCSDIDCLQDTPLTASTLSEGNGWIVAGIGAVAVIALAVVIAKKKKKTAEE